MNTFELERKQIAIGMFLAGCYIFSQDVNDGFSINEIIHAVYSDYEDDPNLRYVRLGIMLAGNLLVAAPAVWLGQTAYHNYVLSKKDHQELHDRAKNRTLALEQGLIQEQEPAHHDNHGGFMHRFQHLILFVLASLYGFAAALDMVYGFVELRAEETHPAIIYTPAIAVGLVFGWGFNQIHTHAIKESSNGKGIFSLEFLATLKKRFFTKSSPQDANINTVSSRPQVAMRQKIIIALAHVGEFYFILREFTEQLSKNPTLAQHFDANQMWYILACIIGSLFGLVEANTEIAGLEIPEVIDPKHPAISQTDRKLAFTAGVLHSVDHATGLVKLAKDMIVFIALASSLNVDWVDSNDVATCIVRGLIWTAAAALLVYDNAKGFEAMLLSAQCRYFKEIPAVVGDTTRLLGAPHDFQSVRSEPALNV